VPANWHAREDGFSLVESLVGLVFIGAIFAAFATVLSTTVVHSSEITEESTLQTELRAAVDTMAAEIRQAYVTKTTFPVESATATSIQFLSPDRDTYPSFHLRRIAYQVSAHKLQRAFVTTTSTGGPTWTWPNGGAVGAWATRLDSIQNTDVFTYQDGNGQPTADPTKVKTVVIKLTLDPNASHGKQVTYTTSATIRASA
jgi:type II secretory pathway component PulJ